MRIFLISLYCVTICLYACGAKSGKEAGKLTLEVNTLTIEDTLSIEIDGKRFPRGLFYFLYDSLVDYNVLNRTIATNFFGDKMNDKVDLVQLVEQLSKSCYTTFLANEQTRAEIQDSSSVMTIHYNRVRFIGQLDNIVSFYYSFCCIPNDGVISNNIKSLDMRYYVDALNVDTLSKEKILEQDIFTDSYSEELGKVIRSKLMQQYRVHTLEALEQEGFFHISEILPNNNFLLSRDGLEYFFREGEIASERLGLIRVALTWDDISHLIRPSSLIEQYL